MSTILIVEDEDVLRLTFARFLEVEGHRVETAASYDEAVAVLDDTDFQVIVTDIILGGNTGVDLLRHVRENLPRAKVIMITGEPSVETASEAVRLGAFDYLAKPVTGDALKRVVRLALEHIRLVAERDAYAARTDAYRRELETIFHAVKEGIITVDEHAAIRQVNAAAGQMLGEDIGDLTGRTAREVFSGSMGPAAEALERTLATGREVEEFHVEVSLPRCGDKVFVVSTAPMGNGEPGGAVLALRDLTHVTRLEKQLASDHNYQNMIGRSAPMIEVFDLIKNVAETDSTVLICGESGTGKELVAAALHYSSQRASGPFVKVNCAALAEDILESELFGHVKGAFTGAIKDRVGRFEAANHGTILLDEVGDISPRLQLRLLRVLQEREFERVGDTRPIRVDVRIIASTNKDLLQRIQDNVFREDLYYRLNVVRIELPPLRARRADIPLLIDHLRGKFNRVFKKEIAGVSPDALELMMRHTWSGNVRELENCLERAFIVCHENIIRPEHLPREVVFAPAPGSAASRLSPEPLISRELSRDMVLETLSKTDWNIAKTARMLGVARNTLYQRIRSYNLVRP